jgi:hypothetical protein
VRKRVKVMVREVLRIPPQILKVVEPLELVAWVVVEIRPLKYYFN